MHFHSRSTFCPCEFCLYNKISLEIFYVYKFIQQFDNNQCKRLFFRIKLNHLVHAKRFHFKVSTIGHAIVNVNSFRIECSGLHIALLKIIKFSIKPQKIYLVTPKASTGTSSNHTKELRRTLIHRRLCIGLIATIFP